MRPLTEMYLASAVSQRRIMETTAPQIAEKLERVLSQWENQGVKISGRSITGLDPLALDTWFNQASKCWKPATANNYICVVNPFLRWAFSRHVIGEDLSGILRTAKLPDADTLPEAERPKNKYYTHDQVRALLETTVGHNRVRDRAIMAIMLYGGFRVSEVCSLTIGQVMDVPRGNVRLRRKGGAWKDAPLSEEAYPFLEAYLSTRKDTSDRNAPLFITSRGKPCSREQIYKSFSAKQRALGLATGPHALRHTAVSEVNNTCGALAARDFANHKSMVVTNRYSHTTEAQRRSAAQAISWK